MEILNSSGTQFYRSLYSMVDQIKSSGLVIYGAGHWGKISWQIFTLFDVAPICFCDDNLDKQGTFLIQDNIEIPVISLDEASEKYPDAVYIAAVTGGGGKTAPRAVMCSRLRERGLLGEYSGFHPVRYLFLLDGGLEALKHPVKSAAEAFQIESLKNMIVFNHMSNSGSIFFDTLMDGHPNIVNIVLFGTYVPLGDVYQKRLQNLEGEELVLETASLMTPYFTSRFPDEMYYPMIDRAAFEYIMNQNAKPEKRIYIDPAKFVTELSDILSGRGKVSFAVLMKAIYAAYASSIGKSFDQKQTYWIFFERHKHNYDMSELDELFDSNDFDRLEYWFIIREPVQHWFSWLKRCVLEGLSEFAWVCGRPEFYVGVLSCDLGLMLEKTEATKNKTVKIVRFEDAKDRTRATMQTVSKWMNIPFDEGMLNTTVNGIPVYFPSNGSGNTQGVISSNDTTATDRRDFSSLMTSYDIFRLNLAFQNFKKAYGYDCDVPDYTDFSLEFLQELYQHPFRFEEVLDSAGAEAAKRGYQSSRCHEYIVDLLVRYMQKDAHELFTDVFRPQETEEEQ